MRQVCITTKAFEPVAILPISEQAEAHFLKFGTPLYFRYMEPTKGLFNPELETVASVRDVHNFCLRPQVGPGRKLFFTLEGPADHLETLIRGFEPLQWALCPNYVAMELADAFLKNYLRSVARYGQ